MANQTLFTRSDARFKVELRLLLFFAKNYTAMNGKIDAYINEAPEWAKVHLTVLRQILLSAGLQETVKWGAPVYVHKSNVVGLLAFKNFVSVWFFQGVFLADDAKVLVLADNKTKAQRQWRFAPSDTINPELVMQYVQEAIYNDAQGIKISPQKAKEIQVPDVLQDALSAKPELMHLFTSKSTSQRNEYCAYVAEAKRDETKVKRVQIVLNKLMSNEGLNDKYKKK